MEIADLQWFFCCCWWICFVNCLNAEQEFFKSKQTESRKYTEKLIQFAINLLVIIVFASFHDSYVFITVLQSCQLTL